MPKRRPLADLTPFPNSPTPVRTRRKAAATKPTPSARSGLTTDQKIADALKAADELVQKARGREGRPARQRPPLKARPAVVLPSRRKAVAQPSKRVGDAGKPRGTAVEQDIEDTLPGLVEQSGSVRDSPQNLPAPATRLSPHQRTPTPKTQDEELNKQPPPFTASIIYKDGDADSVAHDTPGSQKPSEIDSNPEALSPASLKRHASAVSVKLQASSDPPPLPSEADSLEYLHVPSSESSLASPAPRSHPRQHDERPLQSSPGLARRGGLPEDPFDAFEGSLQGDQTEFEIDLPPPSQKRNRARSDVSDFEDPFGFATAEKQIQRVKWARKEAPPPPPAPGSLSASRSSSGGQGARHAPGGSGGDDRDTLPDVKEAARASMARVAKGKGKSTAPSDTRGVSDYDEPPVRPAPPRGAGVGSKAKLRPKRSQMGRETDISPSARRSRKRTSDLVALLPRRRPRTPPPQRKRPAERFGEASEDWGRELDALPESDKENIDIRPSKISKAPARLAVRIPRKSTKQVAKPKRPVRSKPMTKPIGEKPRLPTDEGKARKKRLAYYEALDGFEFEEEAVV